MKTYGYELEDLANYPGDLVLRTSSTKVAKYMMEEMQSLAEEEELDDSQKELLNFYTMGYDEQEKTKNIVTMTIIAENLEQSVIVADKVNKKTDDIIENILGKVEKEFKEKNDIESIDGYEKVFERYVMNHEGNVSLKIKISGNDHFGDKFTAEVILRSNGGYDEIIKALPYISGEKYMQNKIQHAIEQ